jgi:hypothetical protein
MTHPSNPFSHLVGSLIQVTPRSWRGDFNERGIYETTFIALLVHAPPLSLTDPIKSFKTCFLYGGSLYEFFVYTSEISPLP